jgi:type IV pilus assembly protein PilV
MRGKLKHTQQGFGLVESLVALVVVSVGMIGIAVLYGQGLGASRTAFYRTQAVNLASDMADRIRLNRRAGASYAGAGNPSGCQAGGNTDCTVAQMAAHDISEWQALVTNQLPGGVGEVAYAGTTPPTYTIRVRWQEVGVVDPVTHQIAVRVPNL